MEYEPLPGAKKDREEADAISSLQTAARTAANYLRQCGNSVVQHENEDEAAAEMLYTFLCRRESTDIPFLQRISHITSNYIKAGCSIDEIPVGDFLRLRSWILRMAAISTLTERTMRICWCRRTGISPRFPRAG